jgi:hypothetical protein
MASPHVAGLAGLLAGQGLTNTEIRDTICGTAAPITGTGTLWRCGRINALRALLAHATPAPGDYDGDGTTDLSFKTSAGRWVIDLAAGGVGHFNRGFSGYGGDDAHPVPADYDGDGKDDLSVKTDGGEWMIDGSADGFGAWDAILSGYGGTNAHPVPADYDGDGKADLSVKTDDGFWLIDYAATGFGAWDRELSGYGSSAGEPAPADYDGDAKADLSVKDAGSGIWFMDMARNGFGVWNRSFAGYGGADARPVPSDYDGDHRADLSIKSDAGEWMIDFASFPSGGFGSWNLILSGYGGPEVRPVPADYDGDGKSDLAVTGADGRWYVDHAAGGFGAWDRMVY